MKWSGQCTSCESWNSLIEDVVEKEPKITALKPDKQMSVTPEVFESKMRDDERLETGIRELDRVLGGGFVKDSLTLISGDPGIGKSTLALQIAKDLSEQKKKVLYISGEESVSQLTNRAIRLGLSDSESFFLLNELLLEKIVATALTEKPDFLILDSIQVVYSSEISSKIFRIASMS